jgi:hypothetical protein
MLLSNLVEKHAQFDSVGQPVGSIVAVWLDGIGVLQLAIVFAGGQTEIFPFAECLVTP